MTTSLQIYIMSRDRPDYLINALDSVISQVTVNIKLDIIVSDNSETDEVEKIVSDLYQNSNITYVRRVPTLSPFDHFRAIINEVSSEFYMLFHDDDIMLPNLVQNLYTEISRDDDVVAVGSNALIFYQDKCDASIITSFYSLKNKIFTSKEQLLKKYFLGNGIAPYPSYLYRKKIYGDLVFFDERKGGKYSDVAYIMDGLNYGKIIWLNEPGMLYRIHASNGSSVFKRSELDLLINYIISNTTYTENSFLLRLYLIHNYFRIFMNCLKSKRDFNFGKDCKESVSILRKDYNVVLFIKIPLALFYKLHRIIISKILNSKGSILEYRKELSPYRQGK